MKKRIDFDRIYDDEGSDCIRLTVFVRDKDSDDTVTLAVLGLRLVDPETYVAVSWESGQLVSDEQSDLFNVSIEEVKEVLSAKHPSYRFEKFETLANAYNEG